MIRTETGLIVLALVIAFVRPTLGSSWFEAIEERFRALARWQVLAVLLVGVAALCLRAALLPVEPIPEPIVHDEFGYLLAADTFAHGRVTNPTPPMWEHFETFSILMRPTYQCFGQPGQGLLLAFGKVVFGHPFWGVWLSVGVMCAAITWMLQGWIAPGWALLGGILALLRYGLFGYWADSYWGGALAAIGGALVLGALPRIKKSWRVRDALLMGVGLAILPNTRPYEGFIFSLPVAVILIVWLLGKKSPSLRLTVPRVVVPLVLLLTLTGAWLGFYFWRVTGSPTRMPYQIERQTYGVAPFMLWEPVRSDPTYHHAVMRKMYVEQEFDSYKFLRSFPGLLFKIYVGWSYFLGPLLTFPLLMLAFALPREFTFRDITPTTRTALGLFAVSCAAWLFETFYNPQYSAPTTGLILLLILLAIRQLRLSGRRGLLLARAIPIICVFSLGTRVLADPLHIPMSEFYEFSWYQKNVPTFGRAQILKRLERLPDKQLVFVHYRADHNPFAEWVYNSADISESKIIWAREMDPAQDQRLLEYYNHRHVWRVDADENPPELTEYYEQPGAPAPGTNRMQTAPQQQ